MSSLTISARRWHIYRVRYLLYTVFLRVPRVLVLPHFDFLQGDMNTVKGGLCSGNGAKRECERKKLEVYLT